MFKSSKIQQKNTQTSTDVPTLHLSPPNIDRITNSEILSLNNFRSFKTLGFGVVLDKSAINLLQVETLAETYQILNQMNLQQLYKMWNTSISSICHKTFIALRVLLVTSGYHPSSGKYTQDSSVSMAGTPKTPERIHGDFFRSEAFIVPNHIILGTMCHVLLP